MNIMDQGATVPHETIIVEALIRAVSKRPVAMLAEYVIVARTLTPDGRLHQHVLQPADQTTDTYKSILEIAHENLTWREEDSGDDVH